jgi:hypothetical protein
VIGIFTSRAMKERGRYQIQFMKTRSSSGVGQKVDLEFNIDTLRISDLGDEADGQPSLSQGGGRPQGPSGGTSSVLDSLKRTSVVTTSTDDKWERPQAKPGFDLSKPQVKSAAPAIRAMLSNINPEKD